ncbi:hypothetical protein AB1Y20_015541 [Prymnesium parvum]|uniref:Procollagen-proline 4-dioxygenase n=1 Tax=Prymnesium parvum TaxID=97485 RepID=A0AB34JYP6_PRYPA
MAKKSSRRQARGGSLFPGTALMVAALPCMVIALSKSGLLERWLLSRHAPPPRHVPTHDSTARPEAHSTGATARRASARAASVEPQQQPAVVEVGASGEVTLRSEPAPSPPAVPAEHTDCEDQDPNCPAWQQAGECEANPGYMKVKCAASCATCHLRDYKKRCPKPDGLDPGVPPGAMDAMFARIHEEFAELKPVALSTSPHVLQLDNFLTDEECAALIARGAEKGFVRSEDAGAMREDGTMTPITSHHRTSFTAWCDNKECLADPLIQRVMARAEKLTLLNSNHSEFIQILQYHPGQYYGRHHDFIHGQLLLPCGPRVYTLFMYLSDVEEGGETSFYDIGISVMPKKGRAVLWPSVLNDEPFTPDRRTNHEAKPVVKGIKYGANLWLHQHDFKSAHRLGCTG